MASADIEAMYEAAEERIAHLELALAQAEHALSYWVAEAHHGMYAMGDMHYLAVNAEFEREGRWAVYVDDIESVYNNWLNKPMEDEG
jgi:hypothetical protein